MTKPLVESTALDYINMISSMYWMVPTIGGLIVGGIFNGGTCNDDWRITGRVAKGGWEEMGTGSWQLEISEWTILPLINMTLLQC